MTSSLGSTEDFQNKSPKLLQNKSPYFLKMTLKTFKMDYLLTFKWAGGHDRAYPTGQRARSRPTLLAALILFYCCCCFVCFSLQFHDL